SYSWSRLGDAIAFTRRAPGEGSSDENRRVEPSSAIVPKYRLALVDLDGGRTRTLAEVSDPLSGCQWFPDGNSILVQIASDSIPQLFDVRIYRFRDGQGADFAGAAEPGESAQLGTRFLGEFESGFAISIAPGGSKIGLLMASPHPGFIGRISHPYAPSILDQRTARARRLVDRHGFGEMAWSPDGLSFYQSLSTGTGGALTWVQAASGETIDITPGPSAPPPQVGLRRTQPARAAPATAGSFLSPHLSADGQWLVAIGDDFDKAPEVWLMRADGTEAAKLTSISSRLRRFALGRGEEVAWTAADGVVLRGTLIRPVGADGRSRFPLIVDLPDVSVPRARRLDAHWQFFAGRGYAVFIPEHRLTGTYGREAARKALMLEEEELMALISEDTIAGVKMLIGRGVADPERLFMRAYGSGAEVAAWLLARSPLFAAAVLTEPLNLPPESDFRRFRAPMLYLFGGESESGIQALRLSDTMKARGVDAGVVVYGDEGHRFKAPANVIDAAEEVAPKPKAKRAYGSAGRAHPAQLSDYRYRCLPKWQQEFRNPDDDMIVARYFRALGKNDQAAMARLMDEDRHMRADLLEGDSAAGAPFDGTAGQLLPLPVSNFINIALYRMARFRGLANTTTTTTGSSLRIPRQNAISSSVWDDAEGGPLTAGEPTVSGELNLVLQKLNT
ncbi:prolyl oligopeptidase family serine peptidase, partial [Candidatus Sumerlaeota bacterium]|nr:prolyl oligopeptidase family serine peptidase [Candidatus Sumerlaeota bacterium]